MGTPNISSTELREAVTAEAPHAFEFLASLVSRPSLRGAEQPAQELVQSALSELGFEVERLFISNDIGEDPRAGVPALTYDGRFDVIGRRPHDGGRSLLVNGHIDVVPANPLTWSTDPFTPVTKDGWLYGRGAGDMKGGFAMALLALRALRRLGSTAGQKNLTFLSVIEEEYTGNGTLAAVRAGVTADAVLLPEPTDLKILLGGVGITWVKVTVHFGGGHAESSDRLVSPAQVVAQLVEGFQDLEDRYNKDPRAPYDALARPYNVNVGAIRLGEWPSSVPAVAEVELRVGHPAEVSDRDVTDDVRSYVASVLSPVGSPSFEVVLHGFKAQEHYLSADQPLVRMISEAHARVHGNEPEAVVVGSTTDARYYVNELNVPALCFGPTVKNMHGSNECVELASIEAGAATLAQFFMSYFDEGE